MEDSVLKFIQR